MLKAQRKRLRRARRQLRGQQLQLLTMELTGVVAVTLHTVTETLTVPLHGDAAAQIANTLLEVLRERRQLLRREAAVLQVELAREQAAGATPPARG